MDILIPRNILLNKELGEYRISSYIFLKIYRTGLNSYVSFTLNDYYKAIHITNDTRRMSNILARKSLQNVINLYVDECALESPLFSKQYFYDINKATNKKEIFFKSKDIMFGAIKGEFITIKLENVETIINYSKNVIKEKKLNQSYANDLLTLYCYMVSRMAHKRLKNEDGTEHYSDNPIYFYSYKKYILDDLNLSEEKFNLLMDILKELNLIREITFKKIKMADNDNSKPRYVNIPNFYLMEDKHLEDNLKNAMYKYAKEKGYSYKKLKPIFD